MKVKLFSIIFLSILSKDVNASPINYQKGVINQLNLEKDFLEGIEYLTILPQKNITESEKITVKKRCGEEFLKLKQYSKKTFKTISDYESGIFLGTQKQREKIEKEIQLLDKYRNKISAGLLKCKKNNW